jgi:lysophospholipase L1-like esterase
MILVVAIIIIAIEISYRRVIGSSKTGTARYSDPTVAARDLPFTELKKREPARSSPSITYAFWQEMQSQTRRRKTLTVKSTNSAVGAVYDSIEFNGIGFSTTQGLRTTLPARIGDLPRVLVFGGSTVFNYEVPDSETMVSHLQRLLPNRRLENYGVAGATAIERIRKIRSIVPNLTISDHVVLIYGVNDIGWYQHSRLWFAPVRLLAALCTVLTCATPVIGRLVQKAYVCLARTVASRTTETISLLAHEMGPNFVAVLQPQLFTRRKLTQYEVELRASIGARHRKMAEAAYTHYLSQPARNSRSMIDIFDVIEDSVYLDWCHLSPLGLKTFAERLVEVIEPRID